MGASYTPQGKRRDTSDESRIGVYGLKNALGLMTILRMSAALAVASALMAAAPKPFDRPRPDQQAPDKPASEKKKEWKERAEYELYESVGKSQDPKQWLASLDKRTAQTPPSDVP